VSEKHLIGPSMFVCLSRFSSHCYNNDLDHIATAITFVHTVATMTLNRVIAKMPFDVIVAFDTIVAVLTPLVVLLTSSPVMWLKEHICDFSVFQKVHLTNLLLI
jgi:hypothetical protein